MPPLLRNQVKQVIVEFVVKVVHAIDELHGMGIAHLDLRLENICVDELAFAPILIDLDQSRQLCSGLPGKEMYGESHMYERGVFP